MTLENIAVHLSIHTKTHYSGGIMNFTPFLQLLLINLKPTRYGGWCIHVQIDCVSQCADRQMSNFHSTVAEQQRTNKIINNLRHFPVIRSILFVWIR